MSNEDLRRVLSTTNLLLDAVDRLETTRHDSARPSQSAHRSALPQPSTGSTLITAPSVGVCAENLLNSRPSTSGNATTPIQAELSSFFMEYRVQAWKKEQQKTRVC